MKRAKSDSAYSQETTRPSANSRKRGLLPKTYVTHPMTDCPPNPEVPRQQSPVRATRIAEADTVKYICRFPGIFVSVVRVVGCIGAWDPSQRFRPRVTLLFGGRFTNNAAFERLTIAPVLCHRPVDCGDVFLVLAVGQK